MKKNYSQNLWKITLIFLCWNSLSFVHAQPERLVANHWFFGNQYGFDFSNGGAQVNNTSSLFTYESSTTISDKEGNLLFYTNGGGSVDSLVLGYIWNSDHEVMEGSEIGALAGGGHSAAQGALSFNKPGTSDQYYLFTIDELETLTTENNPFPEGKGLSYFEIDMEANAGLGQVTVSNEKLMSPAFENMTATQHGNCEDYWLLARTGHGFISGDPLTRDSFYLFKITEDGIDDPIITPLPNEISYTSFGTGVMRFSPDGNHFTTGVHLFDFDKNTGTIGSYINLEAEIGIGVDFPLAFSPNGAYLFYFTMNVEGNKFFSVQYELSSGLVFAVSEIEYFDEEDTPVSRLVGIPQLGPDGKMYIPFHHGIGGEPTRIYVVEHPNVLGPGAQFHGPVLELSPPENEIFLTFGNFTDHIFYTNPVENIDLNLPDEFIVDCQQVEPFVVANTGNYDCTLWSTGDTSSMIEIEEEGIYWVEVADGCDVGRDTFEVIYENNLFEIELGNDSTLCEGEEIMLQTSFIQDATYIWQDSSEIPIQFASEEGLYWVEVRIGDCYDRDSFQLDILEFPIADIGEDTTICFESELILNAANLNNLNYEWHDGSIADTFWVDGIGFYGVTVSNECGEDSDEVFINLIDCEECVLEFSNVFTPNEDGISDGFMASTDCTFSEFNLRIYNRWGNKVYQGGSSSDHWDGTYKGEPVPADVYFFLLEYETINPLGRKKKGIKEGDVTLFR